MSLSFADASARVHAYIAQFEEGYFPPLLMLARLTEETGEIARVVAHTSGKTPKPGEDVGDLELELADLLFVMLCMANERGLSLERGFTRMMHKVETRDAQRWTRKAATPHAATAPRDAPTPALDPVPPTPYPHGGGAPVTDPRYPIGEMPTPLTLTPPERAAALDAIRALPAELRAAVQGLDDAQLDTPYREGGWTVRQVVHHVADSHVNAYTRVKLAVTEDHPTVKPYEEGLWAELPDSRLPVDVSLDLLDRLHTRLSAVLDGVTDFTRPWTHPAQGRTHTVDTLLGMYAWHGRHHVAHVTGLRGRQGW